MSPRTLDVSSPLMRATQPSRLALGLLCVTAIATPARAGFDIFSVGGTFAPGSIEPTVNSFRAALGVPNNGNAAGPLSSGRREINWDGGGATTAATSGATLTAF